MKKQGNRGLLWSFLVILVVLVLDQVLKIWVKTNMTLGQEIPVIGHWFNLLFIENDGMAFGWLGGGGLMKLLLSLFRIVAIVALFWVLVRLSKKQTKFGVLFGIALITAGAIGNIIDSVFYGRIFSESTYTQLATLFPEGGDPCGQRIRIDGSYYSVVGVDWNENSISVNGSADETVTIPITLARRAYNQGNIVHLICFTGKEGVAISDITPRVREVINRAHYVDPTDEQALYQPEAAFDLNASYMIPMLLRES